MHRRNGKVGSDGARLRKTYVFFIRALRVFVFNDLSDPVATQVLGLNLEAEVFVMSVIMLLCTAGIAFYVRFLVALYKECKPRRIGYWVRLRLGSGEDTIAELKHGKRRVPRAA
jgi:hypothetical protein